MNMNKTFAMLGALAILAGGTALADDFDDFGFDDFGSDGSSSGSGSSLPVELSADFTLDVRNYFMGDDVDGIGDTGMEATPEAKIGLNYDGGKAGADLQLKITEDTIKNHPEDVIDELTLSAYLGNFTLTAGKMKVVWGKGDKLHVLDNFNADDYTDFIIPDYLDRRISTPMIRGVYAVPLNSRTISNVMIEGVYTPIMPVDRLGTGVWTPAKASALTSNVKEMATNQVKAIATERLAANKLSTDIAKYKSIVETAAAGRQADMATYAQTQMMTLLATNKDTLTKYGMKADYSNAEEALKNYVGATENAYLYALSNSSSLADDVYPDTNKFEYGQGGLRVTGSIGQVDLGVSYYYGHYKQPSINGEKMESYVANYLATGTGDDKFLAYDRKQTFGLEFSTIAWKFNLRGEAAYNLTDDLVGDDPWVHNNSIQWLGGFDIDLPFWDANLNVQETGTYILNNGDVEDNATKRYLRDVEYDSEGYTNNKIVVNFTTSFLNGKLTPEVTALYGFEHKDLVVMPKVTIKPASSFKIIGSGLAMWTYDEEKSEFGKWHKNSFIQLGADVSF